MAAFNLMIKDKVSPQSLVQNFPELIHKKFPHKLLKSGFQGTHVCIMASQGNHRAGMLVAAIMPGSIAEIFSLVVAPQFRLQGLAKAMMKLLEQALKSQGIHQLTTSYQSDWPGVDVFEKIIFKLGWETPTKIFDLYKIHLNIEEGQGWRKPLAPLPADIEIFPWSEITEDEKKIIPKLCDSTALTPLQLEDKLAFNSLGVRMNSSLAGWFISHRIRAGIQYTTLFVKPCFRRGQIAMHMIQKAGLMHLKRETSEALFMVETTNQPMQNIFSHRLKSSLVYHEFLCKTSKNLLVTT